MMKILLERKFWLLIILMTNISFAYSNNDSLLKHINSRTDDTAKVNSINLLSKNYADINSVLGLKYANQALKLSFKLDFKKGIGDSYKNIGINYWRMGSYDFAIDNYLKALSIYENIDDKSSISRVLNNIGLIYLAIGQYDKAISNLQKSRDMASKLKDKIGISRALLNIGIVNIAKKDFNIALENLRKSLSLCTEAKDSILIAFNYSFIGTGYLNLGKGDSAYKYLVLSKELFTSLNSLNDIAMVNNQIALYHNKNKDYKLSLTFSTRSFDIGKQINNQFMQVEALSLMSESNAGLKQYQKAYDLLVNVWKLRESLRNESKIKEISVKQVQYEYDKKIKDLEVIQKNELYKRSFIIYASIVFSLMLIIVLIVLIIFYKEKSKSNKILFKQKNEIEKQRNELDHLNLKLNELNSSKDKFFSIIAHDLKNPLGGFKDLTNLLHEDYQFMEEEEKLQILKLLKGSAKDLYSLLENLLQWSGSQRGTLKYNPIRFNLNFIIDDIVKLINPSADKKHIAISKKVDDDLFVFADVNMMESVIRNLLTNAIKFSNKYGSISIISRSSDQFITLEIKDRGIGIEKEMINNIFRIDAHHSTLGTNDETGTGLGLVLCKEFVEKNGGTIWVESESGKGSSFYITIPKDNQQ